MVWLGFRAGKDDMAQGLGLRDRLEVNNYLFRGDLYLDLDKTFYGPKERRMLLLGALRLIYICIFLN